MAFGSVMSRSARTRVQPIVQPSIGARFDKAIRFDTYTLTASASATQQSATRRRYSLEYRIGLYILVAWHTVGVRRKSEGACQDNANQATTD